MPTYPSTTIKTYDSSYIHYLKQQLEEATQEFNDAAEIEATKKAERDSTQEKLNALAECWDKICKTNAKAKAVISVIENNIDLIQRLACNANLIKAAMTNIVVEIEALAKKTLDFKHWIKALLDKLDLQNNPVSSESGTQNISAALNLVYECAKAANDQVCSCITHALETLQLAIELEEVMGDPACHRGITSAIQELLNIISNKDELDSPVKFPREDSTAQNEYYHSIKVAHEEAKHELKHLQSHYEAALRDKTLKEAKVEAIRCSKDAAVSASECVVEGESS